MVVQVDPSEIVLVSSARTNGDRAVVQRAARQGRLVRLARGAYLPGERWSALSVEERHLASMRALALVRPGLVFSHRSAAIAWGLPLIGPPAMRPDVLAPLGSDRGDRGTTLHRTTRPFEIASVGGVPVTTLARTLADVARRCPALVSVPMLDHALRTGAIEMEHMVREAGAGTHVGARRLGAALQLADGRCGSVGESASRVLFDAFGIPRPRLQHPFRDGLGLIGIVDFWWPEFNVIGEFDGYGKYLREEYTAGRSTADIVIEEKRREDRLRGTETHPTVARWGWTEVMEPLALRAILTAGGIPTRQL